MNRRNFLTLLPGVAALSCLPKLAAKPFDWYLDYLGVSSNARITVLSTRIGDYGEMVVKMKVNDDQLWADIKSGSVTDLSHSDDLGTTWL